MKNSGGTKLTPPPKKKQHGRRAVTAGDMKTLSSKPRDTQQCAEACKLRAVKTHYVQSPIQKIKEEIARARERCRVPARDIEAGCCLRSLPKSSLPRVCGGKNAGVPHCSAQGKTRRRSTRKSLAPLDAIACTRDLWRDKRRER